MCACVRIFACVYCVCSVYSSVSVSVSMSLSVCVNDVDRDARALVDSTLQAAEARVAELREGQRRVANVIPATHEEFARVNLRTLYPQPEI